MKESTNQKVQLDQPAIPWRAIYHLLLRQAWLLSTCVVLAIFVGLAYLAKTPKRYASRTVVQVEQSEARVIKIESVVPEESGSAELLKTIEQNFMSKDLLLRVAKNSGLVDDQRFLPAGVARPVGDDQLLRLMSESVSVKLRRGARLIDITAEHTNPDIAQLIAQSVVKEYLRQGFEQRVSMSQMANEFLMEEANRLKAKVEKSEHALQEYRERNHATSLEEKQNITVETLKELNSQLTTAKGARMKLEAEYAQAEALVNGSVQDLLTIPSVAGTPEVIDSKNTVANKEVELATLSQRYRAEHPKFIEAQSQLRELKGEFEARVRKAAAAIKAQYEAAKATEQKFQEALAAQQKEALELNRIAIPYNSLMRDVESDQAMYQAVLKRLKETEVAKSMESSNIRIVESARKPQAPISPVSSRILALSVLGGLVLGVGLVTLLYVLDSSLRTVDDVEQQLGLPVLSAIPNHRKIKSIANSLVLMREPESMQSEAFRSLRTALTIKSDDDSRIVLVTSAVPAEGKSFCSANTAAAFAQQGYSTLLIDADLRRPSLAKIFNKSRSAAGLTDYLEKGTPLSHLVEATDVPRLHFLSAGATAYNPAELLSSEKLEELFSNPVLQSFDRIVIDSAPVNAVSDTLNLVRFVQSVCLVIRASNTPKRAVIRAYHELVEAGGRTVGVLLNRVPNRSGSEYYYHYSAGAYGSEGVYGAKESKFTA